MAGPRALLALLVLGTAPVSAAMAQGQAPDTVYLKGGGSLLGRIVEDRVGDYLLLERDHKGRERIEYAGILRRARARAVTRRGPAPAVNRPPAVAATPAPPRGDSGVTGISRASSSRQPPSPREPRVRRIKLSGGTSLPSSDLRTVAEYGFSFKASYSHPITRFPLWLRPSLGLHRLEVARFSGSGYFMDLVGGLDLMISPTRANDLRPFLYAGGQLGERFGGGANLLPTGPYYTLASTLMSSRLVSGYGAGAGVEFAPFFVEAGVSHLRIKGATSVYFPLQFGFTF